MVRSRNRRVAHGVALATALALPLLAVSAAPAAADWQRGGWHRPAGHHWQGGQHWQGGRHWHGGDNWHRGGGCWNCGFVPGLALGLGAGALAAAPYYYAPPPVYYAPPPDYPAPGYYYAYPRD